MTVTSDSRRGGGLVLHEHGNRHDGGIDPRHKEDRMADRRAAADAGPGITERQTRR